MQYGITEKTEDLTNIQERYLLQYGSVDGIRNAISKAINGGVKQDVSGSVAEKSNYEKLNDISILSGNAADY